MTDEVMQIATIKQSSRAYFAWLGRHQFPSKQISDAAQTCGLHLKTLERMRNPPAVVVDSAKEAFAELEKMLDTR
jgi:hypothetical protein